MEYIYIHKNAIAVQHKCDKNMAGTVMMATADKKALHIGNKALCH